VTPGHLGRRRRLIPVSALSLHSQPKTSNRFLEIVVYEDGELEFPDQPHPGPAAPRPRPGRALRDIAASLGITERSAYGIVADLAGAGYIVKHKDGRRNRYQIQAHRPRPEPASQEPAIGDVLALIAGTSTRLPVTWTGPA